MNRKTAEAEDSIAAAEAAIARAAEEVRVAVEEKEKTLGQLELARIAQSSALAEAGRNRARWREVDGYASW